MDHHDNEHVGRVVAIFLLVHLAHLNIVALECAQNCKVKCTSEEKCKIRKEGKMELDDDTLNSAAP